MPENSGKRKALLVGIGAYRAKEELPPLRTPRDDVDALARVLRDKKRGRFDEVVEIADADAQTFAKNVERFLKGASPEDLVLVYFSGHGMLGPSGGLHLCATDSERDLLETSSLALTTLNKILNGCTIAQVVVVLDCCFSGAADLELKSDLGSLVTQSLGQGRGKYVITSSSALEVSRARPEDELSLFTKWLVHGLESGAPDADDNGQVTLEELFRYARDRTVAEYPEQEPRNYGWLRNPGDVIIGYSERRGAPRSAASLDNTNPAFFGAVKPLLANGKIIPFLGTGIFGDGPLSPFRLSTALAARGELAGQADLATAAEYLNKYLDDRQEFLRQFREILDEQTAEATQNLTHDFVLSLPNPPLIISATYDTLLERQLERMQVPFTIVAHIVGSPDGEHDGRLLVIERGATPSVRINRADQLILPKQGIVVYKVLGSPFLTDYCEPESGLDTVVVTESDHLTFVGRLENQHTCVPQAFSPTFQKSRLLFLGYSLDLWHYRLILRVFAHTRTLWKSASYAVRQPTSQMEELYWKRLGSDMIRGDTEQFAERCMRAMQRAVAAA